jgi:hypothetical protein
MKSLFTFLFVFPTLALAHIVVKTSPKGSRGVIEFDEVAPAVGETVKLQKDGQGTIQVLIEKISGKKAMVKLVSGDPLIMGETLSDNSDAEVAVERNNKSVVSSTKKNHFIVGLGGSHIGLGELEGFGSFRGNPELDSAIAFHLYGGYEFNNTFMVGAYFRKYSTQGSYADKTLYQSTDPTKNITTPDTTINDADFTDFGVMAQYQLPYGFYAQATYGSTSFTMNNLFYTLATGNETLQYDFSGTEMSFGGGYRYFFTKMFFANIDLNYRLANYDSVEVNSRDFKLQNSIDINSLMINFGVGAKF